jgi:hypothetical protein
VGHPCHQEVVLQRRCQYVRRSRWIRIVAVIATTAVSMLAAACSTISPNATKDKATVHALTARLLTDSHSFDALVASVTKCHGVAADCLTPTPEQAAQIAAAKRRVLNDGTRVEAAQARLNRDEG